jgi:hypothetical protein
MLLLSDSISAPAFNAFNICCAARLITWARHQTWWFLTLNSRLPTEKAVSIAPRNIKLLLALSVIILMTY